MKKLFLSFLLLNCLGCFSQHTAKDFFTSDNVVWYGLNFAKAKMVGVFDQAVGAGVANAREIRDKWIPSWNSLIINEPNNYRLGEAFRKSGIYFDLKPTETMNQEIDLDGFVTYNAFQFAEPDKTVQEIVSAFKDGEKKEGIGLVFIVESFNKPIDEAAIYVTVFNIKTKNVLITEKMVGKPVGFGLRNFWGGAIKRILKQITEVKYENMRSKAH